MLNLFQDVNVQKEFLEHFRQSEFIKEDADLLHVSLDQLAKYTSRLSYIL
jgi:hypothetical protein